MSYKLPYANFEKKIGQIWLFPKVVMPHVNEFSTVSFEFIVFCESGAVDGSGHRDCKLYRLHNLRDKIETLQ